MYWQQEAGAEGKNCWVMGEPGLGVAFSSSSCSKQSRGGRVVWSSMMWGTQKPRGVEVRRPWPRKAGRPGGDMVRAPCQGSNGPAGALSSPRPPGPLLPYLLSRGEACLGNSAQIAEINQKQSSYQQGRGHHAHPRGRGGARPETPTRSGQSTGRGRSAETRTRRHVGTQEADERADGRDRTASPGWTG